MLLRKVSNSGFYQNIGAWAMLYVRQSNLLVVVQKQKPKRISKLHFGMNVVVLSPWASMANRSQCVVKRDPGRVSNGSVTTTN